MDKFLHTSVHPNLTKEDINHLNRSITQNEIEEAINSLPKIKGQTDGFSAELYQTFEEELISTLLKLFHKIERKRTLPNSFCEASITLIPKPNQDTPERRTLMQKSSIKYWQTESNNISESSFTMTKLASSQGCRCGSTYSNL
jgi:hypothetical protein